MTTIDQPFFTAKEAAKLLGVHVTTVQEAIHSGRLKVICVGETISSARIPRRELFPDVNDGELQKRRLRRLTLAARDKREAADRLKAEWAEAEREANEALRAIEHELALNEIELPLEQRQRQRAAV